MNDHNPFSSPSTSSIIEESKKVKVGELLHKKFYYTSDDIINIMIEFNEYKNVTKSAKNAVLWMNLVISVFFGFLTYSKGKSELTAIVTFVLVFIVSAVINYALRPILKRSMYKDFKNRSKDDAGDIDFLINVEGIGIEKGYATTFIKKDGIIDFHNGKNYLLFSVSGLSCIGLPKRILSESEIKSIEEWAPK